MGIFRGTIVYFKGDPRLDKSNMVVFEDGFLETENGFVKGTGDFNSLEKSCEYVDYRGKIICPGFIDTHIHYPQTGIIASYGEQLLEWLEKYAFVEEMKFSDKGYASNAADFFVDELLRNGTTSALVMATVHKHSVDSVFEASLKKNLRLISGKVMMDRNAPKELKDTPVSSYEDSKDLIERWHKKERLLYAVTPRFAPTSTESQLEMASSLFKEYDDVYLHSHVAENVNEVKWVSELFKNDATYQRVYDRFSLMSERSVFAHAIYLEDSDYSLMSERGSAISFCPTSNLFIGSGLFNMHNKERFNFKLGIGTDVGGGTSFSMLKTLSEAYKVSQLCNYSLSPSHAFYLATLGGAEALYIDDRVGSFNAGMEADFIVLDPEATEIMERRSKIAETVDDLLFILMMMGDDRSVYSTYVMGEKI